MPDSPTDTSLIPTATGRPRQSISEIAAQLETWRKEHAAWRKEMGLEVRSSAQAAKQEQGVSKEKLREYEIELDILFAGREMGKGNGKEKDQGQGSGG